eukprot:c9825_g2_i1.p1 GENE.c9825_g2_i1~~c9825_g2_i1.p1  ORF type:complete len:636 (-),score=175.65 c9825_g2_i1:75-1727(-)
MWAIMGPSGSGKSTLLNALACRLDASFSMSGDLRMNGRPYTNTELKRWAGYVMQDDLLNAYLTVEETLNYTATLRLPNLTPAEISERVAFVLKEMGITHCKDIVVGNTLRKGISGGERKRLCVAQELLMKPQLLFLDEPTSGLDSATALDLMRKLRSLSRTHCTIVCSIHQPQSKIFGLFDSLILVKEGKIIFHGSTTKALATFEKAGAPVPPLTNPADHILDVLAPKFDSDDEEYKPLAGHESLIQDHFEVPEIELELGAEKPWLIARGQVPWRDQFSILCRRNLKEQWRKRSIFFVSLAQTLSMAILIGTVFLDIGTDQQSTKRRQPVLFFCCINQGVFGSLAVLNSFPSERALSLRERAAGTYNVSAYFLAKSLVDAAIQLMIPVLFSVTVYFLIGLQPVTTKFFTFMAFMMLTNLCATSAALMVSAVCRTTDLSVAVLPMMLEVSRLFGGFFLPPINLPHYFSWLDALSFYKYAYVGISLNELHGLELHCLPEQLVNGVCPIVDGTVTIKTLGFDYITITGCAWALVGYILFSRVVAFLAVKYLKN